MDHKFVRTGILVGLLYWLFDSCVHHFVFSEKSFEFIPTDLDELWMRALICFLFVSFGWYADLAKAANDTESRSRSQAEPELSNIFNLSLELICIATVDGKFLRLNPAWEKVLGYSTEELMAMGWMELVHPDDIGAAEEVVRKVIDGESSFDLNVRCRCKDGTYRIFEWHATAAAEGLILAAGRDITERKRAEEDLLREREFTGALVESIVDGVVACDEEGNLTLFNRAAREWHGMDALTLPPEQWSGHYDLYGPDGTTPLPTDAIPLARAFQGEKVRSAAMSIVVKGGSPRSILADGGPIIDKDGRKLGAVVVMSDITERKRMEEELQKMAKLESIGVLAGGIAHDLNNYLTGIVGNIGLAQMCDDPADKDKRLLIAEEDAMKVKELTQRLITFSKGGMPVRKLSDLVDVLKDAVDFTLSGSNVGCDYVFADDAYPVEIDEGQIRQVINNLVVNAQQAMPEGGKIKVSAEKIELGRGSSIPLAVGPYVKISVEDWGLGIQEEDRKRIFDPFFSTKPKGHGLGLATSYSIIQQHSGHISVESEVRVGTKLEFYLPASSETLTDRREEESDSLTGEGRILAMDDQENIRDIVEISLSKLGYEVVTCVDGVKATEEYKAAMSSGNPFSAVILDLTIPGGMGGRETIKKLKEIDSGVRAIVASGYADDPVITDYRDHGFKGAITKPFGLEGLRVVLHDVLNVETSG